MDTETLSDSDTAQFVALVLELISALEERNDLKATAEYQQSKIEQLQRELAVAVAKNEAAAETFGEQIFGGWFTQATTGPQRPNRPRLTPEDAQNIRRWHSTSPGVPLKTIARYYRVNKSTISRIIRGQSYKEAQ